LDTFRGLFDGKVFLHRDATQGDYVAIHFFEDLYDLNRSNKYRQRADSGLSVANIKNIRHGVLARRGDGSFGEILPNEQPRSELGFSIKRGMIATIEIGIEVKIVQKAMVRQIGRVISDLEKQVGQFKLKRGKPITVGVVGINYASHYVSFEGEKSWATTGKGKYKHPYQEAGEVEKRLLTQAAPMFDEFILLAFKATNTPPYAFAWVDKQKTEKDYGAILVRVSNSY
jgi:hypothetical protein